MDILASGDRGNNVLDAHNGVYDSFASQSALRRIRRQKLDGFMQNRYAERA
jgi:hypothetical protein